LNADLTDSLKRKHGVTRFFVFARNEAISFAESLYALVV